MASVDDIGRELAAQLGKMMPVPKAWRAAPKLREISELLTEIALEIEEDTREFRGVPAASARIQALLTGAEAPVVKQLLGHLRLIAKAAKQGREQAVQLRRIADELDLIAQGGPYTEEPMPLAVNVEIYTKERVKATNAAARYCDILRLAHWAQYIRNIAN